MPTYRTPVFEDDTGRSPGIHVGGRTLRTSGLGGAKLVDCGSFFLVTLPSPSLRSGWRIASSVDLQGKKAPLVEPEVPMAEAEAPVVEAETPVVEVKAEAPVVEAEAPPKSKKGKSKKF